MGCKAHAWVLKWPHSCPTVRSSPRKHSQESATVLPTIPAPQICSNEKPISNLLIPKEEREGAEPGGYRLWQFSQSTTLAPEPYQPCFKFSMAALRSSMSKHSKSVTEMSRHPKTGTPHCVPDTQSHALLNHLKQPRSQCHHFVARKTETLKLRLP